VEVEEADATREGPPTQGRWTVALLWGAANVAAALWLLFVSPLAYRYPGGEVFLRNDTDRTLLVVPTVRHDPAAYTRVAEVVGATEGRATVRPFPRDSRDSSLGFVHDLPSARLAPDEVVLFRARGSIAGFDAVLIERVDGSWARLEAEPETFMVDDEIALPEPTQLPDALPDELELLGARSFAPRPTGTTLLALAAVVTLLRFPYGLVRRAAARWWLRPTWRELLTTPLAGAGFVVVLFA